MRAAKGKSLGAWKNEDDINVNRGVLARTDSVDNSELLVFKVWCCT